MVSGNSIVTANAGDSRAIVGSLKKKDYILQHPDIESRALSIEDGDRVWHAKQVTRDHKPDDPDEE